MKPIAKLLILALLIVAVSCAVAFFGDLRFGMLETALASPTFALVPNSYQQAVLVQTLHYERTFYMASAFTGIVVVAAIGISAAYFAGRHIELNRHEAEKLKADYKELERSIALKTTQLQYQAYVSESERSKFEAIINSITEGMLITDNGGNILLLNKPAQDLLGADESGWYGKPINERLPLYTTSGTKIEYEKTPIYIALMHGQKFVSDVMLHPQNDKRIIRMTATVILTQNNQKIGSVASLRDITRELEVDKMKTEFISLASHQLRTPLSAIRWFSEMLLEGDAGQLSPEQTEFAQNIADSTHRMIDLVNSLLNISRIESGRIMVDPKPTNIQELVQGVIQDLRAKIDEMQHHVAISVHEDLPPINLDSRLISQVYLNLLSNAIKYTPHGGDISVIISKKDDQLLSQISDNGYGIPVTEQAHMFEKFFRAQNIAKIETDGTGLGMYLVKAIITSSGGQIWFKSEEGKGTTFWFSLPLSGMVPHRGEVTINA